MERLEKIDSTDSLKRFMDANQETMLEVFYMIFENYEENFVTEPIGKVRASFVAMTASCVGCAVSYIGDFEKALAFTAGVAAFSLISLVIHFMDLIVRIRSLQLKSVKLYNELITADNSLFSSIERGRFVEDQNIQEVLREILQKIINDYNMGNEEEFETEISLK